jgi:TonB family protein
MIRLLSGCGTLALVCVTLCAGCSGDSGPSTRRAAPSKADSVQTPPVAGRSNPSSASRPKLPVPIKKVAADIPDALRPKAGIGIVTVRLTIDDQGSVVDVSVEASTVPQVNDRIVAACRQWKFEPSGVRQEFYVHQQISPASGARKKHDPASPTVGG